MPVKTDNSYACVESAICPCRDARAIEDDATNLLHDTRLALRESDMATRLIGDELDLDLSSLASWLVIIIVVVVGSGWSLAFDSALVAIAETVVVEGGWRSIIGVLNIGHCIGIRFEV